MIEMYILKNRQAVPCNDVRTWGQWFATAERQVSNTVLGEVNVSTVFIGLDHAFGGGPPLLFETMVFGGEHDGEQDRYTTWEEAEQGHRAMVDKVKGTNP